MDPERTSHWLTQPLEVRELTGFSAWYLWAVTWGASIYALGEFLRAYWAPDACLDVDHGSFDYRNWRCSQEQHDYIDTALQDVPGFWFALIMLVIAIGATVLTRRMANAESTHP
jgi:hypothetical protein